MAKRQETGQFQNRLTPFVATVFGKNRQPLYYTNVNDKASLEKQFCEPNQVHFSELRFKDNDDAFYVVVHEIANKKYLQN
ncbi:hypothetical protein MA9V1_248 [Chryseobacterium phage MA9V-1]|nr:hypothetical protein MA9V1_248 [Chryseobacterium phage MA9V-1]